MKLRILGDTLRLRLSQNEVARFAAEEPVEARVHFGPGDDEVLIYRLEWGPEATEIAAALEGRVITVHIPADRARDWTATDRVGIEHRQALGNDRTLHILVEKDFKCAVPRAGEEDYDGFPNPTKC